MKALDTPKLEIGSSLGMIYKITRRSSGQSYVGLTIVSLKARWQQHVRSAKRRTSPLASAIAKDGPEGFIVEPIEVDIPLEEIADRERYWISALGTIAPYGLNKHPGGAVGGGNPREIEHDGERFRSLTAASEALATQHGLTPSAAHQRLVKSKPLEAPLKVFRTKGRGVAGSFLWSRWRAMRNNVNSRLGPEWNDWDRFASDLAKLKKTDRLTRPRRDEPWGPDNFSIHSSSFVNHPKVGSEHWRRWRSIIKAANRSENRGVVEEWRDFDVFEQDIAAGFFEGAVLIPLDWWRPWGPENFRWGSKSDLGRLVGTHGRKAVKHGDHRSPLYKRWNSMHNDARRNGIRVDEEWHEYSNFRTELGSVFDRDLFLIRPDRNQPWGPKNYQLVTRDEYCATLGRFTHGESDTPLHKRWQSIRANAVALGVGCDDRWSDFTHFAADVGKNRPGSDLARIDPSKPYGPGNFVWVDRAERRAAVLKKRHDRQVAAQEAREKQAVTVDGITYRGLYALAEAFNMPAATVCTRVRNGMSPKEAVTTTNRNVAATKPSTVDGISFPSLRAAFRYIEERYGIRKNTMQQRMKSGLSLEAAARKPLGAYSGQRTPSTSQNSRTRN